MFGNENYQDQFDVVGEKREVKVFRFLVWKVWGQMMVLVIEVVNSDLGGKMMR